MKTIKQVAHVRPRRTDERVARANSSIDTKTLPYEECKQLSNDYLMPNKVIFELHAEFNSLV